MSRTTLPLWNYTQLKTTGVHKKCYKMTSECDEHWWSGVFGDCRLFVSQPFSEPACKLPIVQLYPTLVTYKLPNLMLFIIKCPKQFWKSSQHLAMISSTLVTHKSFIQLYSESNKFVHHTNGWFCEMCFKSPLPWIGHNFQTTRDTMTMKT